MSPNTVYIGRPSKWGNPFRAAEFPSAADCLTAYRDWLNGRRAGPLPPTVEQIQTELRGRDLACWCKPSDPCHGDILLQIANS
jgi:hypothetical protein